MTHSFELIIKFKPELVVSVKDGKIYFADPGYVNRTASYIFNFSYRHVIEFLTPTGDCINTQNTIDFSQFKGLVYLEKTEGMTFENLELLAASLRALDYVEYAYLQDTTPIAPPSVENTDTISVTPERFENLAEIEQSDTGSLSTTPDFFLRQDYLLAQGNFGQIGIEADYAWRAGATGRGIRCACIEWSFNFNHEDLIGNNFIPLLPTSNVQYNDHGAAVAGVIMARNNGFGMIGANFGLDVYYGVSELPSGRVNGIATGLLYLRAGDVFIYEMQTTGRLVVQPNGQSVYELVPPDFNRAVWDITLAATNAGIMVVAAAGNGAANLDHPFYNEYRTRGDNGIIRVGAGTRIGRNRASFSTFGSPIHLQGWGDFSVASAGYGDLFNAGPNRNYTGIFSGTSAATPIVAAAMIAVQAWHKAGNQGLLTPRAMRNLLITTGTPQGTGGHIGPLPNIRRAILELQRRSSYAIWDAEKTYIDGDRVSWNNHCWQANWWTKGTAPGTAEAPWRML